MKEYADTDELRGARFSGVDLSDARFRNVTLGIEPEADPTPDEVLEARANRMARVRTLVDDLTPEELTRTCGTNEAHGYPPETNHQVIACLWTIIDEAWAHNLIANRDLDRLASPD